MITINTFQTMQDLNQTGINGVLVTASTAVPFLPALILFAMFIILSFGAYFSSVRRTGRSDNFVGSLAVAGFVTVVIAFLMTLIPNFIDTYTLSITIVIEIIFVMWLFLSRD